MLQIYNTLTKKKEEFKPLNEGRVGMYVCGPTVYDYFHIGNARSFIMADMIRRYLEYKGYEVKYLMNITDVDDKIIKKANAEGKASKDIAGFYTEAFFEDIEKLKIKRADVYPKATEHMDEIISLIKKLEEKKMAYNIKGNVFYDVNKFNGYGKLSGKKIDELESGSRVEINEDKKNPLDFSLWKKAKEGEPYWESPWANGRPGWHIECSAMSSMHLGETFDIHAGGNDLIFPHHENEIAQSEGASEKKFVNYWIHFGFLNLNDEKMSKSAGNFFTARDILRQYPAEAVRLLFAQTHYSGPLSFSSDLLESSKKALGKINNLEHKLEQEIKNNRQDGVKPNFNFEEWEKKFESAMDDDFNTPQGAAVLFDFTREVNRIIAGDENLHVDFFLKVQNFLARTAMNVFGIIDFSKDKTSASGDLEEEIKELINKRAEAKKAKDFTLADKIRDGLKTRGIILEDSKEGTTYKVVN